VKPAGPEICTEAILTVASTTVVNSCYLPDVSFAADYVERQYYVTGRLTKQIYADDCFFDAPDPDMPVTGLTKYVDAISNLFERKSSQVQLLCIETIDDKTILARWRLEGTLKLPWRPKVKPYTGVTVYHLNEQGLVQRHTELWSITAFDAFVSVSTQ